MSNDNFANATVLAGTTFVGNNIGYTTEVDEPLAEYDGGWATAWHIWITPDNFVGDAIIDTFGSSFDTYLYIYTGTAIDDLTEIDSNDDGGPNNWSKIIYDPIPGTVYYIRVGGYGEGDEGEYVLRYPYTTGSGAAPALHTINGTLFDSTYTQGQNGDVQVNNAVTSGATFDSSVPPLFNTENPGVDIDYRAPGSRAVNNENFPIFGVSAEGFTYIGDVPNSLDREPLTSDTAGAPGGTGEILLTINESGTKNTSEQNQALGVPSVNPDYRAPDRFGPGVEVLDTTNYNVYENANVNFLTFPTNFVTGSDLLKTVNSSVTADSYSIGATTLTNIQVPNKVNNIYLSPTSRGVFVYWYSSNEDISGAPTLDYEIYLSDGTTHRAGRYGAYDNHYYGTFIQCQSSLPVRARIVARNVNGFSQPSNWSSEVTPFNADETGFGMQGIEVRDKIDGIWNADGTLKDYTGSPSVVRNIRAAYFDEACGLSWDAPEYAGSAPITEYYIVVLENGSSFEEGSYGSNTFHTFDGLTNGKEYTFFVWGINSDGLWSPNPAPVFDGYNVEGTNPPGAPTNVTFSENAYATSLIVDWDAPVYEGSSPIDGYSVLFYNNVSPSTVVKNDRFDNTGGSYDIPVSGLTPGQTYFVKIAASNGEQTGLKSSASNTVLYFTKPGAPTGVTGIAGNHQVALSWTAPASNGGRTIAGYRITPYIGATAQATVNSSGTGTTKTITGLTNGTAYTFKVEAYTTGATGVVYGNQSAASAAITPHA